MAGQFEELEFDETRILEGLANIHGFMGRIEERTATLEAAFNKMLSAAGDGANGADQAFGKAAAGAKKLTDAEKETNKETANLKKGIGELLGDVRILGFNLGGTARQAIQKAKALGTVTQAMGATSKAAKVFRLALASTGIGALVLALGALVAYFGTAEKATNKVSVVLAALGGVVTTIFNTIGKLGGAVIKVFQGDFKGAFKDAKGAVTGFHDELKSTVKTMVGLELRAQNLKDRQREAAVATSEVRKEISALNLVASDSTKTFKERHEAQQKLGELEKKLLEENVALRQEELDIIQERNKANPFFADLQAEADAKIALNEIQDESFTRQKKQQSALNALRDEERARVQAIIEKQKELREEVQELVKEFVDAATKADLSKINSPVDRVRAEAELAKKQVELQAELIAKKAKEAGVEVDIVGVKTRLIEAIEREAAHKIAEIYNEAEALIKEQRDKRAADVKRLVLEVTEIEAKELDKQAQKHKDFSDELLRRAQLNLKLRDDAAARAPVTGFDKLGRRISKALGFGLNEDGSTTEEFSQFLGAIESTFASVFEGINTQIQGQIEANQAWVDDLKEKRAELEEQIEIEKERQDEGLANNLKAKEEELAELSTMEAQALKEQEELRKKAVTAQIIQDSIAQTSSLISAAAGIFEGFSKIPILGLALGAAAVASLFAFFASAKAKAKDSARGFEGGHLKDILGPNAATEDMPGRGEGSRVHPDLIANAREYLVNGDSTMANLDHLHKLNAGMYDGLDLDGFLSGFSPDEIADGFTSRQAKIEAYNGLNSARMLRNSMVAAMGVFSGRVVNAIKKKPVAFSYRPGDNIRIMEDGDIFDLKT